MKVIVFYLWLNESSKDRQNYYQYCNEREEGEEIFGYNLLASA